MGVRMRWDGMDVSRNGLPGRFSWIVPWKRGAIGKIEWISSRAPLFQYESSDGIGGSAPYASKGFLVGPSSSLLRASVYTLQRYVGTWTE